MDQKELDTWFAHAQHVLETAYLSHTEPWRQSGMSGPQERWISLRKPVANCIDRSGSFLDIGCANGYLLACCLDWTAERGILLDPYGLDVSPVLVGLAQERLPQYADHFFIGNAYHWEPQRRFDFVRTELVYVPAELEREFVLRLINKFLSRGGKLLVANYGEDLPNPEKGLLPGSYPAKRILERLADLGIDPIGYEDGYDPIKGRRVRIAIVDDTSLSHFRAQGERE
jgi:SAM-dependent methyltransferase